MKTFSKECLVGTSIAYYRSAILNIITLILSVGPVGAAEYHVSAASGSNLNPGSEGSPFLTIQKAADVMVVGDVCVIHGGTYREEVTPASNYVTFRSAPGETVLVTAFEEVTGWSHYSGDIYQAAMSFSDLGDQNQVLYKGQMMNLARWPNKDSFDPFDLDAAVAWGTTTHINHAGIPDWDWGNGGMVWFLGKSRWTSWRVPATGATAGTVYFNELSSDWSYAGSHSPANGGEVILMNILEALDSEGEWYIDRASDTVYFDAPGAGDPDEAPYPVLVRARTRVFNLAGRTGVVLNGLHMEGGKVDLEGANGCVVKNCRIYYGNHSIANNSSFRIYDASIDMNAGTVNCQIYRNDIQWGAGNGIILDGAGNRVNNNHIGNFNYVGSYATAVWFIGAGNQLTRNQIFNAGRDTINGGGDGCEIGYNDVHHSNLINDDCGGIYTCCGTSYNFTRIHHNWWHDIYSRDTPGLVNSYKGAGVYLDNTSREVIVDHNVMWNLEWTCIQFNWAGEDLLLYNNTMWSSGGNSKSIGWWQNGYTISNIQLYNTLANDNQFVSTDEQNSVVYPMGTDPFEDLAATNFMPMAGTHPIDAGRMVPPYTDGFAGAAPDAGAYERDGAYWVAGPDWPAGQAVTDEDYRPLLGLYVSSGAGTLEIEALSAFNDYRIEISTNLMESWTPIHDFTAPYSGEYVFTDEERPAQSIFYRVVERLPGDPPIGGSVLFDIDFTGTEGFSDGEDINGRQNIQAQSSWDAGGTGEAGYATSVGQWNRARNVTGFTLEVGESVVIETTLRLIDEDGIWPDNRDNYRIGIGHESQHSGADTPSIGSTIHTFSDGSYWFGGDAAANRISVSAADAGDWIKFTQTITRSAAANQFTGTVSAYNLTDGADLGMTASAWTQSDTYGTWGGTIMASFRIWQNAEATALQIDRWRVRLP